MIRLDIFEMERYIKIIALRAGMRVQWGDDSTIPATDGKTIFLPRLTVNMTDAEYKRMQHYVVHEVDHVLHTDWAVVNRNPPSPDTLLGSMINLVEDYRIERIGTAEYHGDYLNSNEVQAGVAQRILDGMLEVDWSQVEDKGVDNLAAFTAFITNAFATVYPSMVGYADEMSLALRNTDIYAKLLPYLDEVLATKTTTDVETVCHRIYREVFELDPDEECKCWDEKRKKGGASKEAGEGEEDDASAKGEGRSGKGKAEGDKPVDGKTRVKYKDLLYDGAEVKGKHRTRGSLIIEYDADDYEDLRDYRTPRLDEWNVTDYTKNRPVGDGSENTIYSCLDKTNPNFSHQVRMLLQIRSRSQTRYGQKRGKLQTSAIVRVFSDDDDARQRVFKRKIVADTLDTAVCLLVDQSGSMQSYEGGYSRFTHAATAAVMMSDVIGNVLHIPCEVLSFTDMGHLYAGAQQPYIFIHRRYSEKLVSNDRMVHSFAAASNEGMCNNSDGDHIVWAHHHLMQQKQKRKVLIVFSDGQPAGGWRGNTAAHTRSVIREIEKSSPVHIIAIGIGEEAGVDKLYKDHRVLKSIKHGELERQLLSVIEQSLR